ncbi:MAG: DUF4911 domain-containing protein [Proteobacteria bacterium]|nr:DUF4911 domain-containing protein [Pseudomonadota bacterium]MBU1595618.1 DUF4911 domain-containing protein [Pseudomonadota bacterium]
MRPLVCGSGSLYVRLARSDVAMFRFLLEANEGLALFSSLGADEAGRETLLLRFAPGARAEVLRFLEAARTEFPLELLPAA